MAKRVTIENSEDKGGAPDRSSIDKAFGSYTNSVIVALLFIFTLIAFVIYFCNFKSCLSDTITTGFIGLLSGLAGYFVASLKKD